MNRDKGSRIRCRRTRRWAALERVHLRGIARAVPVLVVGTVLALFALCLTALSLPAVVAVLLRVLAAGIFLSSAGWFICHLSRCLHARGMMADVPEVLRLLAEQPDMDGSMAEWLIARARVSRGLLHSGFWLTGWILAAGLCGFYMAGPPALLLAFIASVAAGVLTLVMLLHRALALFWISTGLGLRKKPGSEAGKRSPVSSARVGS